jgi:hypothetical protein
MVRTLLVLGVVTVTGLVAFGAFQADAAGTKVQAVACEDDEHIVLNPDGTVARCTLNRAETYRVRLPANPGVPCSKGSTVYFDLDGYLTTCNSLSRAETFVATDRQGYVCGQYVGVHFDQDGYLYNPTASCRR